MSKYSAKKAEADGYTFDSKAERDYYLLLAEEKKAGKLSEVILQPSYELQPAFEKMGKKYRAMKYTPDFLVTYNDGSKEAIDVKGFETKDASMRRKMFDYKYRDIKLRWIRKKGEGWADI